MLISYNRELQLNQAKLNSLVLMQVKRLETAMQLTEEDITKCKLTL